LTPAAFELKSLVRVRQQRVSAKSRGLNVKPMISASGGLKTRWGLTPELHHVRLAEWQFIAQRFGLLRSAKTATEADDTFGAHAWRGKQITSIGK
jgi:hypothetical protein